MANFDAAQRRNLNAKGDTMAGGRYPIRNTQDLANAYKDYIRTGRPADVAAWIGKRAKELGAPNPITGSPKKRGYDDIIGDAANKVNQNQKMKG